MVRIAGVFVGALVLVALGLVIAHDTAGFGSSRFSYFIEEWLYDFVTMTAALVDP